METEERYQLLVMGVDKGEYRWVLDNFNMFVEDRGVSIDKFVARTQPNAGDVKNALENKDMENRNASWIRGVPDKILRSLLEHIETNRTNIWAYSVYVEEDWELVASVIDYFPEDIETAEIIIRGYDEMPPEDPPDMKFRKPQPKNKNAPFSYDPSKDYYTEPDG